MKYIDVLLCYAIIVLSYHYIYFTRGITRVRTYMNKNDYNLLITAHYKI